MEEQPSKIWPFLIKKEVKWVLGVYIYIYVYLYQYKWNNGHKTYSFHVTPDPVDPVMSLLLRPSFLFWAKPLDAPATRRQLSKWSLRQGDKG